MFRKYVIVSVAALFFVSTACTSKKAHQDDGADADVEASVDDESLETAEATENNLVCSAGQYLFRATEHGIMGKYIQSTLPANRRAHKMIRLGMNKPNINHTFFIELWCKASRLIKYSSAARLGCCNMADSSVTVAK